MAYASVLSLAQTIEQILHLDDQNPSTSAHNHKQHFKSLHEHVALMQAFLDEYPDKDTNLEGRIRDTSNEADDIIGTFMWEQIRSYYGSETFMWKQILSYYGLESEYDYDFHKLSQELQKVTREMGFIAEEVVVIKNATRVKSDLHLDDSSSSPAAAATGGPSSKTPPSTGKDHIVVGFDEDLIAIKERLCGDSPTREVIPIHGMGGIGKTTLARYACDDPLIREYFHIHAWVTMSQNYNLEDIISRLLASLEKYEGKPDEESKECGKPHEESKESKDVKVHKILMGRRYLIVVDDIWSTKAWDDIRRLFPNNNNGSRIMLTTRESDVAACANSTSSLHEMRLMDVDQSWNLLRERVFKKGQCPPELEAIGKMIAKSCRGLPLATVIVAGILSTVDKTRASWEGVAKHVISDVSNDEQFAKIFSLSYTHLPHHLRSCFLYLGAFPEDQEIRVSKLIKLWTAEGFMKTGGSKTAEDELEKYLEDLVQRSLILVSRRKANGKIKCCSIHDLLRDLSIRKAEEQKLLLHVRGRYDDILNFPSISEEQRRVSMSGAGSAIFSKHHKPLIRTILRFDDPFAQLLSLKGFRLLRVLDIAEGTARTLFSRPSRLQFRKFPDEVLELFFLRYLAIYSAKGTFKVPSLILKLQNLQTLVIIGSGDLQVEIPREIWMLLQLRHLVLPCGNRLPNPGPEPLKALENLQTLATVIDFKCSEEILRMIPNLRKLKIMYRWRRINWAEYQLHNLIQLHQLEKISISSTLGGTSLWGELGFPKMLKKLKLAGFLLRMQDMEIIGSLPNLEVLKLRRCNYEDHKWETTEGGFPKLIFLDIQFTNLEQWITERYHIPSLKRLRIYKCGKLGEIPDEIGEIPSLELIEVDRQDYSLVESANRIKEEQQQSYGNDSLQVRII